MIASDAPVRVAGHFALFGLDPVFGIDLAVLEQRYRRLQSAVHPDRHASAGERQRCLAAQESMRLNEAYATLKEPGSRARYLLALLGQDPLAERRGSELPPEFLMSQLVWREAVEDARRARDASRLERIQTGLRTEMRGYVAQLAQLIDVEGNLADAGSVARRLAFLGKVCADIAALIDELDA